MLHIPATIVLTVALAALLLFMPVSTLFWVLFGGQRMESALLLMYVVMLPVSLGILLLARRVSFNRPCWANIGIFLAVGGALVAAAFGGFVALSFLIAVTDSSHGGTLVVFVLGMGGLLMACTSWLLWQARRSQLTPRATKNAV